MKKIIKEKIMRKITLLCVGNLKEKYLKDAFSEYQKRISKFFDFNVIEIAEVKLNKNNEAEIQSVIEKESLKLLEKVKGQKVIVLDVNGESVTSPQFAKLIEAESNFNELLFIIGGSYGFNEKIKKLGKNISFSKMTFPHQLMRVIFSEQLYRAGTILNNIEYHK